MGTEDEKDASYASSDDEEELDNFKEEKKEGGKGKEICKAIIRFFFSFVGLFILLALYTGLGAFYFYDKENYLENHRYQLMNHSATEVNIARDYILDRLDYIVYDKHGSFDNCTVFTDDTFFVSHKFQYGESCLDRSNPLMKASKFCNCLWVYRERFENETSMLLTRMVSFIVTSAKEKGYNVDEDGKLIWTWDWTFTNSLLFTMTTLTLIGYGHIAPSTVNLRLMLIIYILIGLPLTMVFLANIGNKMADIITWIYSRLCCRCCRVRRKKTEEDDPEFLAELEEGEEQVRRVKDEKVGVETYMPTDDILVPITITLCIMGAYCVFGALIYVKWEGWPLMDAVYFTFITLTTIGFGDMVPGSSFVGDSVGDTSLILKMLFTTFYCLFGLALIAMGISLMQESIEAKAGWFADNAGMNGELADMDRYILTKHYNVKETAPDKNGNRKPRKKRRDSESGDDSDFDNIEEIKEQHGEVDEVDALLDCE